MESLLVGTTNTASSNSSCQKLLHGRQDKSSENMAPTHTQKLLLLKRYLTLTAAPTQLICVASMETGDKRSHENEGKCRVGL